MKPKEAIRDVLRGAAMFGILFVLCVVGCFMNPPKIYGLCGVKFGEKWNGEHLQFLNSSPPEVFTLEDGRVYRIKVKLTNVSLERVLELIHKKYDIEPEHHIDLKKSVDRLSPYSFSSDDKIDNCRENYRLFKDPHSRREIKVWQDLVDDNSAFPIWNDSLSDSQYAELFGHPRGKISHVYIEALDVDLLIIANKESARKQDERDRELIKGL